MFIENVAIKLIKIIVNTTETVPFMGNIIIFYTKKELAATLEQILTPSSILLKHLRSRRKMNMDTS
jgi:hypothetical protein